MADSLDNLYVMAITVLLPITACMVVTQKNPYHALVIRGILGAVAALVYALFGAADVALTEALVGTMLSITLYAIAVRSSLSMRLGVSESTLEVIRTVPELGHRYEELLATLRLPLQKYHMRLEVVPYPTSKSLEAALQAKDIHAMCTLANPRRGGDSPELVTPAIYQVQTRIQRLYDLLRGELPPAIAHLTYVAIACSPAAPTDPPPSEADITLRESVEVSS